METQQSDEIHLELPERNDSESVARQQTPKTVVKHRQTHAVVWVLFGVVLAAFIVAFALIGVALNPGSDNVKLSNDPFAPSGHVFGGAVHAGSGEWVQKRNMSVHRSDLSVVYSPHSHKIYVMGGFDSQGNVLPTVEVFDPFFEVYENVTVPEMPTPRYRFATAAVGSKIFAIGGWFNGTEALNSIDILDLETEEWSQGTPMIHKRGDLTASVVDGKIYVIGGFTETFDRFSLVEAYDPDTGSWERHEDMPTPRGDVGSAVHKGCIYATGGWNSNPEPNSGGYTDAVERFCPGESPEWTKFPDLPSPRGDKAVAVFQGYLMVVGGEVGGDVRGKIETNLPVHDVLALLIDFEEATGIQELSDMDNSNGEKGRWIRFAPHPGARYRFAAVAHGGPQGNHLFTFGGHAEQQRTTGETWAFYDTQHPVAYIHYKV